MKDVEFAELFDARVAGMRRTAYLLCGDWYRAEDLTQTAFAKVYAAWPRLGDPAAADAYLKRTLVRTYIDDYRRAWRRREAPTDELPELPDTVSDPTDDRLLLLTALAAVPPRQRACLVLRYYDDLAVETVAEILSCSVGTVKSNTARGLAAMRRILGDALPEFASPGKDLP